MYRGPKLQAIVIAAGVNNRDSTDVQRLHQDLQRAVRACKDLAAEVRFAQVMHYPCLSHKLPGGLKGLNRHIRGNYTTLKNPRLIWTLRDGLHLTTKTTERALHMWASQMHL